ncbi:DUF7144 family membrane protein [Actinomadura madurae]|uniref:DUF7144 domain-containing protein n=1 Tax=Actinomadura madurae TaxID=1993 RepID=A0A1I5F7H3_9ACTN|nr:hypothetical protein [Actinomadura madurae]SFO19589.1 hypothetical protein SAMN04489713_104460 [Actinomadura madurae]SPT60250.1 Uncharacterised protein [Actinomadura madurae]
MTQGVHSPVGGGRAPVSGWAVGFAVFAGCMMIMVGLFGAIVGIAAIVDDDLYVVRGDYVFTWDLTAWGWIHLVLGIIVVAAGAAVFTGRAWARALGIVLAVLSAIANFIFLPYYPVWSIVIIALDIAVIWSLARYSRQAAAETWG